MSCCEGDNKRKLRVAYVSEIPTPYRRPFLKRLADDSSLELTVFYLASSQEDREWKMDSAPYRFEVTLPGIHWCSNRKAGYYNRFNPTVFARLSPRRYDAVIFGAYYLMSMWAGMYWCILRRLPYVLLCESHGKRLRDSWRVRIKRLLIGPVIRNAAAWLPLGSLAKDYLVSYGADPNKCFFCPNTPDVETMQQQCAQFPEREALRKEFGLPVDKPLFLYVGRFIDIKRVDILLEAYSRLRKSGSGATLALVGSGVNEESLHRQVREQEIPGVHFLGFQQPEDLPRIYSLADVLVLPSDDEPWAVVVNEAMACGTPVIASDRVGAAADMVVEKQTGCCFPAGDVRALTILLSRVAGTSDFRARMAVACRRQALDWGYGRCHESVLAAVRSASGAGGGG